MPILTFRLSEATPCIDPRESSVTRNDAIFHMEYSKNQPACLSADTNFRNLNVSISLFDLQEQNDILELLERNRQYTFSVFPGSSIKKQIKLNAYTRPTIPWKLECDNTEFDRKSIFKTAYRGLKSLEPQGKLLIWFSLWVLIGVCAPTPHMESLIIMLSG